MAEPVRCDVCGKLFSSRHVGSHKRLAHARLTPGSNAQQEAVKKIVELFQTLSAENKERVLASLTVAKRELS